MTRTDIAVVVVSLVVSFVAGFVCGLLDVLGAVVLFARRWSRS
jgi:nitrate reductase gamma subunit